MWITSQWITSCILSTTKPYSSPWRSGWHSRKWAGVIHINAEWMTLSSKVKSRKVPAVSEPMVSPSNPILTDNDTVSCISPHVQSEISNKSFVNLYIAEPTFEDRNSKPFTWWSGPLLHLLVIHEWMWIWTQVPIGIQRRKQRVVCAYTFYIAFLYIVFHNIDYTVTKI